MEKKSNMEIIKDIYFSGISEMSVSVVYLLNGLKKEEQLSISDLVIHILAAYNSYLKENNVNEDIPFSSINNSANFQLEINGEHKISIKLAGQKNEEAEDVWEINISGGFFVIEHFRTCLLMQLKPTKYSCYCLKDQVSAEISKKAYPLINELENIVREYLLRFFVKKVGSNWWAYNSNDSLKKKSKDVGTNRAMNGLLNMEIYNIDFVDLKELITGSFPRLSNSDIIQSLDAISKAKEEPTKVEEKIERLKQNWIGNWEKFFQEHIQIDNFKVIWDRLYNIRCMVCHNSLITLKCFLDLVNYYEDIKPKFGSIIEQTAHTPLSQIEKEAIEKTEKALEHINAIEAIPIKLTDSDLRELIVTGKLNLTMDNLPHMSPDSTFKEFKEEFEKIIPTLSPIGEVETFIIQGEEIDIPSCWIKFKPVSLMVVETLRKLIGNKNNDNI